MKYPTVSALCEGVAGAIRAKEGSSEKINPQDFAQRIDNLHVGGGTDGGENNYEYIDVRGVSDEIKSPLIMYITLIARFDGADKYNTPLVSFIESGIDQTILNKTLAVMVDPNLDINMGEGLIKCSDVLSMLGADSLPRITKEQFYTLE